MIKNVSPLCHEITYFYLHSVQWGSMLWEILHMTRQVDLECVWEAHSKSKTHVLCFFCFFSRNIWLFLWTVHGVHCLRTHKFYFLATFSLKMDLTILFTHLKIILLQYFSVFSFSFQFSTVSKRILILCCQFFFVLRQEPDCSFVTFQHVCHEVTKYSFLCSYRNYW